MKRATAVKRIKALLNDYRERLGEDKKAWLYSYMCIYIELCPLCKCCRNVCSDCVRWPREHEDCISFKGHVNRLKTRYAKLRLIDKLEQRLDEWEAQDG